ncbi:histone-lysine N-methyltransferase family member SUVH9-like [Humulus lupulus]|uniref:histone-lysine N-methyltransferase family member SUVH9-like n=1 Tax=Humulus lupulus TaxID=3486 RepID=UPI002B40D5A4|nr:histone-lysine N-methyltransferase family member SUVH9-like [Humulus lupulus]
MMGSLLPFQDLNLLPESSSAAAAMAATTSATTTTPIPLKVPKLEPKLEPFEEALQTPNPLPYQPQQHLPRLQETQEQPFFSSLPTPTPNPISDSQLTPFTPFTNQTLIPLLSQSSADESNVFSEFHRISELFKTAFSQGDQDGDSQVSDPDSRAIVPFPEENQVAPIIVSRKRLPRSAELVRVTNLGIEDETYFRNVVRRTRMIFDSLRVLSTADEERKHGVGNVKRLRGDLKASSIMRDRELWLNRDKRIVGSIPGVYVGDLFFFRMELCVVGLHGQVQAGIDYVPASQSSNGEPIATSVIISGGYEDDEDAGDVVIYTGHGGQDKFNKQCAHQKLEGGNLALERSMHYGIEVRVIRGIKHPGSITSKVYVYDGLYRIMDCWFDVGKSGFGVYKYKLVRIDGQPEMGSAILRFAASLRAKPLTMRPAGYLSLDISLQKEGLPVLLFNDIDADQEPLYYDYLVRTVFPPFAFHRSGNGTGCECTGGCTEDCFCAMKNGGELAYDHNGILLRGKPLVFECGPFCRCPPQCRNRVTQNGIKCRLEVFRSRETGWGVRSLDLIQAGAFICEYTGVILTREQAHIVSMNGDNLVYPHRFSDRWAEWGELSQIYDDYVRPSYPPVPPLDFAIDVSKMRNVACYMTHSSTPNVMVQFVLYDHNNLMFPHLMLFAMENIPPLRELSLDYGVAEEWTPKLSICN